MRKKLMVSITWLLVLILSIGCTKNEKSSIMNTEENISKGGYVEEIIEVSDDLNYILNITKLDNGDLLLCGSDKDLNERVFVSSDNGVSWIEREIKHLSFDEEVKYTALNLINNGNILITYVLLDGEKEIIKYAMADSNGDVSAINLDIKEGISPDGLNYAPIYFVSLNNNDLVYRAMDTGEIVQIDSKSLEEEFRFDGGLMYSSAYTLGDNLIIKSPDTISAYNVDTGQAVEILSTELINNDELGIFTNSASDKYLYNYSIEGLYSYELDSKENTLLISDSKYIADPDSSVDKLVELDNNSYLTLISNISLPTNKLVKYSYDSDYVKEDISDVVVYSLTENSDIRRKIAMYESNNPSIEVKYEIGVSSTDGVEISDAIKTLNTEIMTGEGPDIILLDGLPADSYIENEVLADLSDIVNESETFEGILNSYKIDEIVPQIPLSIKVPMLIGNKDVISKINDIDSLLEVVQESSRESDNKIFSTLGRPEDFIASLYCVYGENLITDEELNADKLIEFMSISKDLYNIAKEKDDIFWKSEMEAIGMSDFGDVDFVTESKMDIFPTINVREVIYPIDKPLLGYGGISNNYNIEDLVNMQILKPEIEYEILTRDGENIFIPYNNIAINKNTENLKVSKDIVKSFIDQNASKGNLTISRTGFINMLQMNQESDYDASNDHYIKYVEVDVDENGNKVEYSQYWANEDDINKWVTEIDKLDVAVKVNMTVLNEISKQFKSVIEEELAIEKAVSNVIRNLEIYLAE